MLRVKRLNEHVFCLLIILSACKCACIMIGMDGCSINGSTFIIEKSLVRRCALRVIALIVYNTLILENQEVLLVSPVYTLRIRI
jgi:hypothetical protein